MPDCARCKLPIAEDAQWLADGELRLHWPPDSCISALLAESQRLRDQLAAELALSGAIARLHRWATLDPEDARSAEFIPKPDGWSIAVIDCPYVAHHGNGPTFHAALTAALNQSEGI